MPEAERSPYMPPPPGSLRARHRELCLRLVYDVWRRRLKRYGWTRTSGGRILECGSGPGYTLRQLRRWFPWAGLVGLDSEPELLVASRLQAGATPLICASAEQLPFPDGSYDLIMTLHMVEHLHDPTRFLAEAARVLRPGGLPVMGTPNPGGIGARLPGRRWAGWRDDHISVHPIPYWLAALGRAGFTIVEHGMTGLSGLPLLRTLPFALVNWAPLFLFGFFPWRHGEALLVIARRVAERPTSSG